MISSIGITAQGQLMNVNADQAAIALAELLDADLFMRCRMWLVFWMPTNSLSLN